MADLTREQVIHLIAMNSGHGVVLRGVDLSESDLRYLSLVDANLGLARLCKAILTQTDLSKANLEASVLEYADLGEANLQGANLRGAVLNRANFWHAKLKDANLDGAKGLPVEVYEEVKREAGK